MRILAFPLLAMTCICACAQPGYMQPTPLFNALDKNGDGVISAAEIDAAPASLRAMDQNHDGRLTQDEFHPAFGGGREPSGPTARELQETLMAFDGNKDGKLSRDELPERMQGIFDRGDTDKDGFLTLDEIAKLAAAQLIASGPERGRGPVMDPLIAALDADHDGIISAAEMDNAPAALRTLDKNHDGQLTGDEVRPAFGGRGRGRGPL